MLRLFLILTLFLVCSATTGHASDSSVGVVDVSHIMTHSGAAKDIRKQREKLREKFLAEISKIEQSLRAEEKGILEERPNLSQEQYREKRAAYEAKLTETRKQAQGQKRALEEASTKAMDALREQLYVVVQSIANERDFSLVISNKNVITGEKSLDITEETLKRLNESAQKISVELEGN